METGLVELSGILSGSKSYGQETISITQKSDDSALAGPEIKEYVDDHSWRDEITEFADAIENDLPVSTGSADDALNTMSLVERIYCADPDWRDQFLRGSCSE